MHASGGYHRQDAITYGCILLICQTYEPAVLLRREGALPKWLLALRDLQASRDPPDAPAPSQPAAGHAAPLVAAPCDNVASGGASAGAATRMAAAAAALAQQRAGARADSQAAAAAVGARDAAESGRAMSSDDGDVSGISAAVTPQQRLGRGGKGRGRGRNAARAGLLIVRLLEAEGGAKAAGSGSVAQRLLTRCGCVRVPSCRLSC
jgi:hypothetical protein